MKYVLAMLLCLLATPAAAQLLPAQPRGSWNPLQNAPEQPHPSVVRVIAPEGEGTSSLGSGTVVASNDKQSLVITNWHVVKDARAPITVAFADGFQSVATILKTDQDWDLAALAIWKANVQPVPLAAQPPRPGEMLTIAGYGPGLYRSATGPCIQYMSPGPQLPYDIIEMAASARNGDSGGPIFNARGELAGVLFGEGGGRTSGSHCNRVRWFLTSLISEEPAAVAANDHLVPVQPVNTAATPTRPDSNWTAGPTPDWAVVPNTNVASQANSQWAASAQNARATQPPPVPAHPVATHTPQRDAQLPPTSSPLMTVPPLQPDYAQTAGKNIDLSTPAGESQLHPAATSGDAVDWDKLTGSTPLEKIKSLLAVIGAFTVLVRIGKNLHASPPAAA